MAEVGTGNSVDVNFRVLQTSFDAKGEAGANINTQTADVHDNLDPSLTLALFSEKHPGREFPRRLCDPLLQYDFIVSAVVSL